jgi:hypothetical protein
MVFGLQILDKQVLVVCADAVNPAVDVHGVGVPAFDCVPLPLLVSFLLLASVPLLGFLLLQAPSLFSLDLILSAAATAIFSIYFICS